MKRAIPLLLGLCLLVPTAAEAAADAAAAAAIDCKSAKVPTTDWATYHSTCRSQAAAARKKIMGDSNRRCVDRNILKGPASHPDCAE